jgi:inhibitor of KinA sporulation pathway (predicted exonuclease)
MKKMEHRYVNVIDFELIQDEKPEIVQLGLAVVDLCEKTIIKNIGFYIKPHSMKGYNTRFFELTGIKQKLIENGFSLKRVIEIMNLNHGLKNRPFVCFGKDWKFLIEECNDKQIKIEIDHVFDLSLFFMMFGKEECNLSLENLLKVHNVPFEGLQHNAIYDAYNSAKLFIIMFDNVSENLKT